MSKNKLLLIITATIMVAVFILIRFVFPMGDTVEQDVEERKSNVVEYQGKVDEPKENNSKIKSSKSDNENNNNEEKDFDELTEKELDEITKEFEKELDKLFDDGYDYDELDSDEYDKDVEVFEEVKLEDIYGKNEVEEAKKVTEKFLSIFHNYDGTEPDKYIKKSKKYLSKRVYEELLESPEVPRQNEFYRKYISSEFVNPNYPLTKEDNMMLVYYVDGQGKDAQKKDTDIITNIYVVELKKKDDSYIINNIAKDLYLF